MTKRDDMTKNTNELLKLISLEEFFKNPEITQVRVSPNGKYLAYLKPFQKRLNIHVKPVDSKRTGTKTDQPNGSGYCRFPLERR